MKKSEILRLKQQEHVEWERKLLYRCDHPFIVKMFVTWKDERNLYMLQEFVQGGELGMHLRDVGMFSNETARFFSAQVSAARGSHRRVARVGARGWEVCLQTR